MKRKKKKKSWRSLVPAVKSERRKAYPRTPDRGDAYRDRSGRERLVHGHHADHVVWSDLKDGSLHSVSLVDWLEWAARSGAEVVSRGYPVPTIPVRTAP